MTCNLNKFKTLMAKQIITFKMLENWALVEYKKGNNPCAQLRDWLKNKAIPLRVDYMETETPISPSDVIKWVGNKNLPMVVMHSFKVGEVHKDVSIFLVDCTELNRPSEKCVSMLQRNN